MKPLPKSAQKSQKSISATAEQWARWQALADADARSLSAWIVAALEGRLSPPSPPSQGVAREVPPPHLRPTAAESGPLETLPDGPWVDPLANYGQAGSPAGWRPYRGKVQPIRPDRR
jgi:hypothetical protein